MSNPRLYVHENQRGCTSKFNISVRVYCSEDNNILSDPYHICDMARIQFKFINEKKTTTISASVSLTKVESVKDCTIKVNVTCESPTYTEHGIICTDIEEWRSMGRCSKQFYLGDWYIFEIQVTISVSKIKESSLLAKIYEDVDEFIDFHLSAADGTVPVHKLLLAASSDMFRAMLKGDWKETTEGRIELKGVTRQTLQHLKNFMYLGTLPDGTDELIQLLELAARYLINNLRTACVEKLTELVTSENLYAMLEMACANNIPDLAIALLETTPGSVVTTASKTRNKQDSNTAEEK